MSIPEIISTVVTVICAIICGVAFYFRVKGNVIAAVSELIALAETTGLAGPEKMAQVVTGLSNMVPTFLRKILTPERLERIAQWVFDWMRKYANEYMKASAETGGNVPEEKTDALGASAAAELITGLFNLTAAALKEKATEIGADLEGRDTKKEIIEAIVLAILNKA